MRYFWAYWFPFSFFVGFSLGGAAEWLPLLTLSVLHPLLDITLPRVRRFAQPTSRLKRTAAELALLLYPFTQTLLLVWAWRWINHSQLTPADGRFWLFAVSLGLITGASGITAAHELIHRRARWQRALGVLLLSETLYAHYRVEHVYGHHANVGMRIDPATARRGEWIYAFWLRAVFGGIASAYRIERQRLKARTLAARVFSNRLLHYSAAQMAILGMSFFIGSLSALLVQIIQAIVAILLLEAIDYIEHYGLSRESAEGRPQPISAEHSWDSDRYMTNAFLFHLGMHAMHHLQPSRPFEDLEVMHTPESGRLLPGGYSAMLILSLLPPLYFKVLDSSVPTPRPK